MTNLFYHRCRVSTFRIQSSAHQKITSIENSKLRASSYKLYRWMCSRTSTTSVFSAQLKVMSKATGLSKEAIINARRELQRINLIRGDLAGGPGGAYQFTLLNADKSYLQLDWGSSPWPSYFTVPVASMPTCAHFQVLSRTESLCSRQICWLCRLDTTGHSLASACTAALAVASVIRK